MRLINKIRFPNWSHIYIYKKKGKTENVTYVCLVAFVSYRYSLQSNVKITKF